MEEVAAAHVPILVCVHGAGMSSDNFLLLSRELSLPSDEETAVCFQGSSTSSGDTETRSSDPNPSEGSHAAPCIGDYSLHSIQLLPTRAGVKGLSPLRPTAAPFLPPPPAFLPPRGVDSSNATGTAAVASPSNCSGGAPGGPLPLRPPLYPACVSSKERKEELPRVDKALSSLFPCAAPALPPAPPSESGSKKDDGGEGNLSTGHPRSVAGDELEEEECRTLKKCTTSTIASSSSSRRSASPSGSGGSSSAVTLDVCTVMYDMRCHGRSTFSGGESSLTLNVLVEDFLSILQYIVKDLFPNSLVFVLGHSLGAAVVAQGLRGSASSQWSPGASLGGVVILDAVEGTAKMSIQYMHEFLQHRPEEFSSVKDAIRWFLRSGGMRTAEGAGVSVPPLLRRAVPSPPSSEENRGGSLTELPPLTTQEKKTDMNGVNREVMRMEKSVEKYIWRSHLPSMETVWNTWFDNLDANFLRIPSPKMLCVASLDRLDRELTVAHMQGKFQLEVCGNNAGHYIQDDAPAVLAAKLRRFIKRTVDVQKILKGGGSGIVLAGAFGE